jgi:HlyD family secretion protein
MTTVRLSWILVGAALLGACSRGRDDALTGYAEADLVYVAPAVAGRLQTLAVQRGGRVMPGAPLFALEGDSAQIDLAGAQAREQRAAAQVVNLRKGKRANELAAIEQQLAQARASLVSSKAQLERGQKLVQQGFTSAAALDELTSARDRDVARVAELQAQLAVARDAARPDEIAAADAERRAAGADLAQSRWREGQTQRVAPVAATVYDVTYRVGEWVPAGAPVVVLLPDDAVKVRFFVPEPMLARMAVGRTVKVGCDSCAQGLTATVSFVSPQAEFTPPVIYSNESRGKLVFMVEARPAGDAARLLKPGQPVDVRLAD